jgi:PhnB protein
MPVLDSYLFFNGNCAQAMRFYEKTLGAKLEMMSTFGESPAEYRPADSDDRIMHASLDVGGRRLMASDTPKGQPNKGLSGFSLSLGYTSVDEAKRVFDALAAGGQVVMPMGKTFWAESFGMLTDQFGVGWMVSGGSQG